MRVAAGRRGVRPQDSGSDPSPARRRGRNRFGAGAARTPEVLGVRTKLGRGSMGSGGARRRATGSGVGVRGRLKEVPIGGAHLEVREGL